MTNDEVREDLERVLIKTAQTLASSTRCCGSWRRDHRGASLHHRARRTVRSPCTKPRLVERLAR